MLELKDFYFVRHGETDSKIERRGMGQQDIPLNTRGIEQAHMASRILEKESIELVCFSPLQRWE